MARPHDAHVELLGRGASEGGLALEKLKDERTVRPHVRRPSVIRLALCEQRAGLDLWSHVLRSAADGAQPVYTRWEEATHASAAGRHVVSGLRLLIRLFGSPAVSACDGEAEVAQLDL